MVPWSSRAVKSTPSSPLGFKTNLQGPCCPYTPSGKSATDVSHFRPLSTFAHYDNLQAAQAHHLRVSFQGGALVKTQFSWQWYYYVLTPEGVDYLREWLNLPNEIVPATHKKAVRPPRPAGVRPGGGEGTYRAPRGDRGLPEEGGRCTWRVPATVRWCRSGAPRE
ncbi:40S ribosomal protein S10-A [Grifola frondosa]|uniref:40S ribosomal protein S10-A n=1 Tax=Grifola frondosa TaxID=5627 RepID=A0A1C7LNA2_GRIFR|nr:40S ribosomal protein S10-A [Grifola frondosa]